MKEKPYQHLPPLEHRPDGSPYRMTPAQRKRASSLIRRECCNCDGGNCLALDDGDACPCPQMISFSVCCKCSAGRSCRWTRRWKRRFTTGTA